VSERTERPKRAWKFLALVVALAMVPFLRPPPYITHVLILTLLFAYLGTAWNLIGGYGGQLSLGHGAFFGLGAYASTLLYLNYGLSPWMGMAIAAGLGAGSAALIGYPCFRFGLKGPFFALATLAFGLIVVELLTAFREVTGGSLGIFPPYLGNAPHLFQFAGKEPYYLIALVLWASAVLLVRALRKTRYYLVAIREDEEAAAALGVPVRNYKLLAAVISGALSGIGGTFYAQYFAYINPESAAGLDLSVEILAVAIFGGMYGLMGPTLGSAVLTPMSELLRIWLGGTYLGVHLMVYGLLLILVIIFMPAGVLGKLEEILGRRLEF
jgi:branched-chain amino acid transport system permease protein